MPMEESHTKDPGRDPGRERRWLTGVFLFGCLLFSYPLLALVNVATSIGGIPLVYAYLFVAWAGLIALIAAATRRSRRR